MSQAWSVPKLTSRQAPAAVILYFVMNGLVMGAYGASLPALRAKLAITDAHIAVILFCSGLAGILGMQIAGRLSDALGGRRVTLASLPVLGLAILSIGLASSFPVAILAGVLIGFGNGTLDVSMNAMGVAVEQARPKPLMSLFHGTWSIGSLTGAATVLPMGYLIGSTGPAVVTPVALTVAAVVPIAWIIAFRITPETPIVHHVHADGTKTKIPRAAYLLGIMAIGFGLAEGTAYDWSSLHVTDVAAVPESVGSLGLISVAGMMMAIRLVGDGLVSRFGRRGVVRFGGACAAIGYTVVAFVTPLPLLVLGWCLVGLGVGLIAPQVYAAAGYMGGGRGLAFVVTFGYTSFLAGPATIGALVHAFGIAKTMLLPAALCAFLPLAARVIPQEPKRA